MKRTPIARKTPMKRGKGPRRSPTKPSQPKREWPNGKRGPCLVCGDPETQLAHTVGRAYQDDKATKRRKVVPADAVVNLCRKHHALYDARRLSLLGLLTFAELRNAVRACRKWGIDARRRLGGGRS
ncbi:hypothetical protein GBA65_15110 [Rubrobacter marinus]|uniref:Uncharacterized protein n=1 Tax=Rubrobacter marinus TaxID=2653852 RepID=A0A6G8PZI7_9ACTN|nr:hypothetical protein [Rubrobacter marinus]QIN79633.1 hypothetical protein GBA65_15110 [Rubrobacter marinus]